MKKLLFIDLSMAMENKTHEPRPPEITYVDHKEFLETNVKLTGLNKEDFHDGLGSAMEYVKVSTHSATHMDAPYHYGPVVEGKPARTIDEVPLEWCYGDGVVLDMRHKRRGEEITVEDVEEALRKIGYTLKPRDIVLIMTGLDKLRHRPDYTKLHPGMSKAAVLWLIEQGILMMGTDAFGFDRPFDVMADEFRKGDKEALFPAHHLAGRKKEYCHMEHLTNLDKLPKPFGFKLICFPINVARASGGWVRPVAIFEEEE